MSTFFSIYSTSIIQSKIFSSNYFSRKLLQQLRTDQEITIIACDYHNSTGKAVNKLPQLSRNKFFNSLSHVQGVLFL